MARPLKAQKKPVIKIGERKRKGQRTIKNEKLHHTHLVSIVRKRLKMTSKQIPANFVQQVMGYIGKEISDWLVNNPEGFRVPFDMGYMALSKYIMIPFREDRWEIVNKIKNLSEEAISERFREIVIKRYSKDLTTTQAKIFIAQGKVVVVPMWYNQRNCSIRKARVWKWMASGYLKKQLKKADKTKYHYYNFDSFYDYKVKIMDK